MRLGNFFPDPDAGQTRFPRATARMADVRRLQPVRGRPRIPRQRKARGPSCDSPIGRSVWCGGGIHRGSVELASVKSWHVPRGRSKHPFAGRRAGWSGNTPEAFGGVEFARDPAPDRARTAAQGPHGLDHRHGDGELGSHAGSRACSPRELASPDPPRSPGISAPGPRSPAR